MEKFKIDAKRLLEKEGLLPKRRAEFVLQKNSCMIDGKKLPSALHEKLLKMGQKAMGRTFESDTKIVLQLNEK